jgi:ABC-type polysaccharide transport system, permease component
MKKEKHNFLYEVKKNKVLFIMIAPTIIFFFINCYLPMVGIYFAFTRFDFNGGLFKSPFVGFENFKFLVSTGTLLKITLNTVLYNLAFILIGNALQIFIAILMSEVPGKLFKKTTQSIMFLPYFVSYVILNALVYNIFNFESGFLNTLLKSVGAASFDAYNSPWIWKYILVALYLWKQLGYGMVIYLATIMGINDEYYEASEIDGANVYQQISHITLPLLKPTFIILFLFSIGSILRGQFDLFYQVIGSNGILFNATDIIDTYVFRALKVTFDVGMGTAAGLYQSLFGFIIIMITNHLIKRNNSEYALF